MVNLNKWEEVDFFDIKLGDEIKGYIKVSPTLTEIVSGKVVYMHSTSDKLEGRIHVAKDWENHALVRDRVKGKPENTSLYRRKPPTQEELDAKFEFPAKLGAIVSSVPRHAFAGTDREYHVYDGGEWSTAHTSIDADELRRNFKEFELVRKGIEVG
jgi:hypothetical protein